MVYLSSKIIILKAVSWEKHVRFQLTIACGDQRHAGSCLGRRPCTSRRRVQGCSQGTTLSASDLHNARATILNPFYNMECKIIKKIRQNTTWIKADILGINLTPNQYNAHSPQPLSTSAMMSQSHSTLWRHNSNTKNVTASAREWNRNRFEIYGSALKLISISLCTRGVTIRLATIRYISRYTTHDMVHDTIQNQLIYYQWKILKHCGMCHQYCYIKTVILARNREFKINKDVHNHPCPKYLLLTNCVCKQNNKIL